MYEVTCLYPTPVHKSRVTQAAIRECKFEQLIHPPYSPNQSPGQSDDYLFRYFKFHLRGTSFRDDDEPKVTTKQMTFISKA